MMTWMRIGGIPKSTLFFLGVLVTAGLVYPPMAGLGKVRSSSLGMRGGAAQRALLNPVSAQSNIRTITNGDTSVFIGKNSLSPGANLSVLANANVTGGKQSIGAVSAGGNTTSFGSRILGGNVTALANLLQSSFVDGTSAQSNALNKTTGNLVLNLEATNAGNVHVANTTTVVGGETVTKGMTGFINSTGFSK